MLSPSECEPITIEAPAGRVPSLVQLPNGQSVKPDARGRITVARAFAASLINTAGWQLVGNGR